MRLRRTVTLTLAAALLLTGCTDDSEKTPDGQAVEIVAGGGADRNATKALDAQLTGQVDDFGIGRDGVIRVMTTDNGRVTIRLIHPDGSLQRIDLDPTVKGASQLAVADNGTMYVSHSGVGTGAVSRVETDGRLTAVLGNGRGGFTPDGGLALGPAGYVAGIAVDRQGRLVYGESLTTSTPVNHTISVLRRIETDGTIKTLAGNSASIPDTDKYQEAIRRSIEPPDGTKALGWSLPGGLQLATLAVGDDGTIFAQSLRGVLAFAPDGTVTAAARQRYPEAAPIADRPFTDEGDAADAALVFNGQHSGITEGDGYVAMVLSPLETERPAAYRWTGEHTPGQQAVIDAMAPATDGAAEILRLVKPDGRLTTAAWSVDGGAVRDGWVYLLTSAIDGRLLVGRLKLPN